MQSRVLILTLPSVAILALLAVHAWRTLPRRRALAFVVAGGVYGVVRALGVERITAAIGGSFPYVIHDPLFTVFGVSLQEVAGWLIVGYLGWWLGERTARRLAGGEPGPLFVQVLWAALWLAAVSWAIETTAIEAGWWSWTIPAAGGPLGRTPLIGLIDWGFVAIDFLLPFVAWTSARRPRGRYLWLIACFPLHFLAHLFTERVDPLLPIPGLHVAHWGLGLGLLGLALRSRATDEGFGSPGTQDRWAVAALAVLTIDLVLVQILRLGQPALLVSVVPMLLLALPAWRLPGAAALRATLNGFRTRRVRAGLALALLAATAYALHAHAAARERRTVERLDGALKLRDQGRLDDALHELTALAEGPPQNHAAFGFAGEIHYRMGRVDAARRAFESALRIQPDFPLARRHLVVIHLQTGDPSEAERQASAGLSFQPGDLQLRYLLGRARGDAPSALLDAVLDDGPQTAHALAGLAFEVGDAAAAAEFLDRALERWPRRTELYERRYKLALAAGRASAANEILARWLDALPDDRRARAYAAGPQR